jgi:hypothetical protein
MKKMKINIHTNILLIEQKKKLGVKKLLYM